MQRVYGRLPRAVVATVTAALVIAAPAVAEASGEPLVIPDGEYHGVIFGMSALDFGAMTGSGSFQGEMTMSVDAGAVVGTYAITGVSVLIGPDAFGTGEYESSGAVSGSATGPLLEPDGTTINMTMTLGGITNAQTMEVPGGESSTLALTGGDCGVLVARWTVSAAGMTGEGTVLITPTIDMTPDEADYMSRALALQTDVDAYTAALSSGSTAASLDLAALVERADALRQSMRRNEECGLRPSDEVVDVMLGNALASLLEAALAHPESVSDLDLGLLTNAAAAHGVVGPDSPGGGANELGDALVAEWQSRLDEFVINGDSLGVDIVAVAAEVLGDAGLAEDAAAAEDAVGG